MTTASTWENDSETSATSDATLGLWALGLTGSSAYSRSERRPLLGMAGVALSVLVVLIVFILMTDPNTSGAVAP